MHGLVGFKPSVDDLGEPVQLRPFDRHRPTVTRRRRECQNLLDGAPRYVEMARCSACAHAVGTSQTNLPVQFHGVNLQALPALSMKGKVDGFYSARSRTIPPLPWPNFAPPFPPEAAEARSCPEGSGEGNRLTMQSDSAMSGADCRHRRPGARERAMAGMIRAMPVLFQDASPQSVVRKTIPSGD